METFQIYIELLRAMCFTRIYFDRKLKCYQLQADWSFYLRLSVLQVSLLWSAYNSLNGLNVTYTSTSNFVLSISYHISFFWDPTTVMLQLLWLQLQQRRLLKLFRRLHKISKSCGPLCVPQWMFRCWLATSFMQVIDSFYQFGNLLLLDIVFMRVIACTIVHQLFCNFLVTFYIALISQMARILHNNRNGIENGLKQRLDSPYIFRVVLRSIEIHDDICFLGYRDVNIIFGPLILLHMNFTTTALPSAFYVLSRRFIIAPLPWTLLNVLFTVLLICFNYLNIEVSTVGFNQFMLRIC